MRTALCLPVVAALLLGAPAARAQGADLAAAQGLFDEAKRLVADGKVADACPKFLASYKLDAKPGTALNLADCYEKTGQIASAWARYLETAALAQRAGQAEREQYAREHAAALEPKLARLGVSAPSAPRGLEVLRDGAAIDLAILGVAVPVDPGKHVIEARAPGKKAWTRTVEISGDAARVTIEIPTLEDAPVAKGPAAGAPPVEDASSFPRKPVGLAAIGVGGAGILVGAITGGLALKKRADLAAVCNAQGHCTGQQDAIDGYHLLGTVSTVGFVVGGALAVTGAVLVATAPKKGAAKQARVTPVVGPGFAGLAGRF